MLRYPKNIQDFSWWVPILIQGGLTFRWKAPKLKGSYDLHQLQPNLTAQPNQTLNRISTSLCIKLIVILIK